MKIEDVISLRPYHDGRNGGWQAGYGGHYVRASTREAAIAELRRELAEVGVELPLSAISASGSIRVALTQGAPNVAEAAENLPCIAFGATEAEAVDNLRELSRLLGAPCPEHVYSVHGAIKSWMN